MLPIKNFIRNIFIFLKIDLTKNLKYDRLTKQVIKKAVSKKSVCVDIGCHKGEIFDLFIKQSPSQKHYGFEPIPSFYKNLKKKYKQHYIFNYALSNKNGETEFQYVKNAPAYSGIKNRKYSIENPEIETIKVPLKKLDDVLTSKVDFMKIDVEGGELDVLKGAKNTILTYKPIIIFECGLGASDYYQVTPQEIVSFITNDLNLKISLLDRWLSNMESLSTDEFINLYNQNKEYYFIAYQVKNLI